MAVDLVSCTACGAQIWWGTTIGGRRMPIDPTPDPAGTVLPVLDGGKKRIRVLTVAEMPWQGTGRVYRTHWVTCPKSDAVKRRRTGPRCAACHNRMDTWLVEQHRRYHVNCAPSTVAERRLTERLAAQDAALDVAQDAALDQIERQALAAAAALDQIERQALAAGQWADPHPMTCTCTECYVPDREAS